MSTQPEKPQAVEETDLEGIAGGGTGEGWFTQNGEGSGYGGLAG